MIFTQRQTSPKGTFVSVVKIKKALPFFWEGRFFNLTLGREGSRSNPHDYYSKDEIKKALPFFWEGRFFNLTLGREGSLSNPHDYYSKDEIKKALIRVFLFDTFLQAQRLALEKMNLNTSVINPQDGRMRPTLEEGAWFKIRENKR